MDFFRKFDWIAFFLTVLLVCIGLTAIYSITTSEFSRYPDAFWKQLFFAGVGLLLYVVMSVFEYKSLRGLGVFVLLLGVGSLVAVLFFGATINNARSWFVLGAINIQPAEFVKIALVVFLAEYLDASQLSIRHIRHLIVSLVVSLFLIGLIILQPDLGTAAVFLGVCLIMLPVAGVQLRHYFMLLGVFVLTTPFLWFAAGDRIKRRFAPLLNPDDPEAFNVRQAKITLGSGGLWGKGIGKGSYSQGQFLPEHHTDFIFSTIGEELGFVGIAVLLFLFGLLFVRILTVARQATDNFGTLLAIGVFAILFFQVTVNVGVNLGLLPVTGITLPLISYGGSSMVATFVALGLVQSVALRRQLKRDTELDEVLS